MGEPTISPIFGAILTGHQVQQAVIAHCQDWAPAYIAEMERQAGLDAEALPMFRSWTTTPQEPHKWVEAQLPAVLCVSPGIFDEPSHEGDGLYQARWTIGLAAICSAATEEDTDRLSKLYAAVLRAIMVQHPSLGGFADGVDWLRENYDFLPVEERRTLAAGYGLFAVGIGDVTDTRGGLQEPPENPYEPPPEWPAVESAALEAEKP